MESDPEVALMFARKTAETVCKILFKDKISEHVPPPTKLEDLLDKLRHGKHLPQRLELQLRTIQSHGNFGSHDQGDDSDEISADYVEPCVKSLDYLCKWLLKEHLGGQYQTAPLPKEPKKDSPAKHCYLKPPITIKDLAKALEVPSFALFDLLKNWEIIANEDSEISPEIAERLCKIFGGKSNKGSTSLRHLGI
jgi:hypothetical protein